MHFLPTMSSFLTRAAENSKVQFAATAVVSGAIVAAGILGYQRLAQEERVSRLKHSIPEPGDDHPLQKVFVGQSIRIYETLHTDLPV